MSWVWVGVIVNAPAESIAPLPITIYPNVLQGRLVDVDLPALVRELNRRSADLVARTEKRYHLSMTAPVHRRAYPYQPA